MELESVGGVSVGNVGFKVGGKVKNLNGIEGTPAMVSVECWIVIHLLLDTDTTTDTELFRNERLLVIGIDFNTKLAHLDYRT